MAGIPLTPTVTSADVLGTLPTEVRASTQAPVRDAFVAAFTAGLAAYETLAARTAALSDPLRSTGDYLREHAELRGVVPARGESDASIQSRMFAAPLIVTPNAIVSVVNALIAPYTSKLLTLFEPELDGLFICDGSVDYGFIGVDPTHLDRLYPDDSVVNGMYIPQSSPGGAAPSNGYPRTFVMRVPALEGADDLFAFVGDAYEDTFITDGTVSDDPYVSNTDGYVFANTLTTEELYSTIIGTVERIKGQGISWTLFIDTTL